MSESKNYHQIAGRIQEKRQNFAQSKELPAEQEKGQHVPFFACTVVFDALRGNAKQAGSKNFPEFSCRDRR